jgi:hypothetical protein
MSMAPGVPGLRQDVSYAFRLWRKHPLTAALAVAALAVGIGAAAAIFSIVNAVLIQQLPYREPGRLVVMWNTNERDGFDIVQMKKLASSLSPPEYHDWRTESGLFEEVMAFYSAAMRISQTDDPGTLLVYHLTARAFPFMGVAPLLGRGFEPQDERPGAESVIVLQHEIWQSHCKRSPALAIETTMPGRASAPTCLFMYSAMASTAHCARSRRSSRRLRKIPRRRRGMVRTT